MGEELAMVLYAHEGSALDEATLREHLASRVAGFKVPKYITLTDGPLPRNNSEKLDKLACRKMYYPDA
jgi:acyl-CoA synthetase (AMP-forming)/AMP-acid ligase II